MKTNPRCHRHPMRSKALLGCLLTLLIGGAGCGKERAPVGSKCVLNTDCNSPLSCSFGRCHTPCRETRDCPLGARCVRAPEGNVCQLEEHKMCGTTACQGNLVCGTDFQCRNKCSDTADCPLAQQCSGSLCVGAEEPPVAVLPPAASPDTGTGAPLGDGGVDGSPGDDTVGPSMGTPDGSAEETGAGDALALGPCGVPEQEPNDQFAQAVKVSDATTLDACLGGLRDVDVYELTAPDDPAGGFYQIDFTNLPRIRAQVTLHAGNENNARVGDAIYTSAYGQNAFVFFASSPGATYRISFTAWSDFVQPPAPYTISIKYNKLEDAYEPNNRRDHAKTIPINMPITAFFHAGQSAVQIPQDEGDDWYKFTVAAGAATITLESLPVNHAGEMRLYSVATGGEIAYWYATGRGMSVVGTVNNLAAGEYLLNVSPWNEHWTSSFGRSVRRGEPPVNWVDPYTLTVKQ